MGGEDCWEGCYDEVEESDGGEELRHGHVRIREVDEAVYVLRIDFHGLEDRNMMREYWMPDVAEDVYYESRGQGIYPHAYWLRSRIREKSRSCSNSNE